MTEKKAPGTPRSWLLATGVLTAALVTLMPESALALPDLDPEQPPGTEGFTTILNWIVWAVIILGLAGFLCSAGYLAFAAFTGREVQGFKGLIIALIVCILATGAGAIIAVFI